MFTTIETRLKLDTIQENHINNMIIDWAKYYHQAWSLYNRQQQSEKQIYDVLIQNKITSHQIKSIINKVKIEHSKIKALTISQAKNQVDKINQLNNFIQKSEQELITLNANIKILKLSNSVNHNKLSLSINKYKKLIFTIEKKKQKLDRLNTLLAIKQKRINSNNFKLCFGSSSLFKQQHGKSKHRKSKEQIIYKDKESWRKAWSLARVNQIYSTGDLNKPQFNQEIQYYPQNKTLKIRLTNKIAEERLLENTRHLNISKPELLTSIKYQKYRMESRFITIENVEFNHRYLHVFNSSLTNKKPIAAKIIKKLTPSGDISYYLQLSMEELNHLPEYKIDKTINKVVVKDSDNIANKIYEQILNGKPIIGIDLNASGLAYTVVKVDGNRLVSNVDNKPINGFISWDLKGNTSSKNKHTISETLDKIIEIALVNNIKEIAIENLDFSNIKSNMNSGLKSKFSKNYNEVISSFVSTQFKEILIRKCFRNNIIVKLVNPSFSSIGGYTKYGIVNKTKVDVSASLWLARQGLYGIPYKVDSNVVVVKKHEELVSLPYSVIPKQSKKELNRIKWKEISLAIGKDRTQWYLNTIEYIKSLSGVVQTDNFEEEFNLFQNT